MTSNGDMPAGRCRQLMLRTLILIALCDTSCALLTLQPRQISTVLHRPFCGNDEQTHTQRRRGLMHMPFYNGDITPATSLHQPHRSTTLYSFSNNDGADKSSDDDKKKKNKGEQKKSSVSRGANEKSPNGKSKRPYRRRGNQQKSGKQQSKRNKRQTIAATKNEGNPSKSKLKGRTTSMKTRDGNRIDTSDENTSLRGFKETKQKLEPAEPKQSKQKGDDNTSKKTKDKGDDGNRLKKRVTQLESLVSTQMSEIQKLRREVDDLTKAASVFSNIVDILREAGLQVNDEEGTVSIPEETEAAEVQPQLQRQTGSFLPSINDDMPNIFGFAPTSVTDAADAAGSSILSAILAGKQRMLVDVRDAELTSDPKLFVEFLELAILPVAAGLEGLDADMRNRVKIVFPTVKDLMVYRKAMALAAPEVVALSTLGFDPVEEQDKLIVVVAPSPDDLVGVDAFEKLLARTQANYVEPEKRITQPIVAVNHHMVPIDMSTFGKFSTVYHLRLLSVQYMTGDATPEYVAKEQFERRRNKKPSKDEQDGVDISLLGVGEDLSEDDTALTEEFKAEIETDRSDEDDAALEAAMTHAHEIGVHQGVTRAMVIRAYPK